MQSVIAQRYRREIGFWKLYLKNECGRHEMMTIMMGSMMTVMKFNSVVDEIWYIFTFECADISCIR